jgi:hypothetical protein
MSCARENTNQSDMYRLKRCFHTTLIALSLQRNIDGINFLQMHKTRINGRYQKRIDMEEEPVSAEGRVNQRNLCRRGSSESGCENPDSRNARRCAGRVVLRSFNEKEVMGQEKTELTHRQTTIQGNGSEVRP